MPNIREHIDNAKKAGIDEEIAVIVNFKKGLKHNDPTETDISLLTEHEKEILRKEGLIK